MPNNMVHAIYLAQIQILIDRWPKVFNKNDPLPLPIGAFEEIIATPNLGMYDDELEATLVCWTARREYCKAIVELGWRYTLDGKRLEPISPEEIVHQSIRLARFRRQGYL